VYTDTPEPAFDLLRTGRADAWASVGFALQPYSVRLPGSRVLEDRYGANHQAMVVPKSEAGRLSYISEFIDEAKASGLVQRAIDDGGLRGIHVAPPGNPE
jgi:polar amino acid transport system substrate-binding protein